jgi:hypothetical protein
MRWVAATTLILAAIVCIEVIIQNNPLTRMAQKIMEDFVYLSPENYKFLDSYYRPYAIFFHPSEAVPSWRWAFLLSFTVCETTDRSSNTLPWPSRSLVSY